jgi:GR25 family glycosyltransferase involved in LPS biosynthesis
MDRGPIVSVLVPTENRHRFIPRVIRQFTQQTFDGEMELVIHDSTFRPYPMELTERDRRKIVYVHAPEKMPIGKKRNLLHELSMGQYLVWMDDDDVYHDTYVSECVRALSANPEVPKIARTPNTIMYKVDTAKYWNMDRIHKKGCINSAMGYHRDFLRAHKYSNHDVAHEEKYFTANYTAPVCDMDTKLVGVHVVHPQNTANKNKKGEPIEEHFLSATEVIDLHTCFPVLYWINLRTRKDRYNSFTRRINDSILQEHVLARCDAGDVRFDSSKCSTKEIACFLSHIKAMKTYLENEVDHCPFAVVCEDDLIVTHPQRFYEQLFYYRTSAPPDWEVLQLHRIRINREERYTKSLHWSEWDPYMFSTAMYLIQRDAAKKMVDEFENTADLTAEGRVVADNTIFSRLRTYSADFPYFQTNHLSPSDINKRHADLQKANNRLIKSSLHRSPYPFES